MALQPLYIAQLALGTLGISQCGVIMVSVRVIQVRKVGGQGKKRYVC